MGAVKSTVLNAAAIIIRLATGLALNKVLAIFVGPSGYAIIGQFQSFIGIGAAFASGGINTGVTKYTAENSDTGELQLALWSTAFILSTAAAASLGAAAIFFRVELAIWFLKDKQYAYLFIWFGLTLVFLVWNGLILAVLNGKKELRRFITIGVVGSVIGLAVSAVLVMAFGLPGAMAALVISPVATFFVAILMCWTQPWFKPRSFLTNFSRLHARLLSGFVLMALVSAIAAPLTQMVIRDLLLSKFGLDAAGYWQAMSRISDMYLMVVTAALSFYYLPRLSEISNGQELRREILKAYAVLLPTLIFSVCVIYYMRAFVTETLFSKEFIPVKELFFWQLVGDVMKIGSWLLAFIMIARAMTVKYIVSEVCFNFSLIGLTIFFTNKMGLEGAVFAFAVNYLIYWFAMYVVCRKNLT
ncbi:O-antigen translocase [Massilia sp. S19_KUP03_FR1]|uniref:O-antigen translocase n=1 Tax=Massilia sp. S19_KUP03_FR1 TaxID=3025503 RepID=UPI002FCDD0A5